MKAEEEKIRAEAKLLAIGISRYNNARIRKSVHTLKPTFEIGSLKLYCYSERGKPILLIPSHINKPSIFDLSPKTSFIKRLIKLGLKPYLIDWGSPSIELTYDFDAYLEKSIFPAIDFIYKREKKKFSVLGYCMGGLFAIATAFFKPKLIDNLITIATPWNFHAKDFLVYSNMLDITRYTLKHIDQFPYIPKEFFQLCFYYLRPFEVHKKFISFATGSTIKEEFIDIENWVNDGLDMSKPLFKDCLHKLIINNQTFTNNWTVLGQKIDLKKLKPRTLCAISSKDKVTPTSSTLALPLTITNAKLHRIEGGHLKPFININDSLPFKIKEFIKEPAL